MRYENWDVLLFPTPPDGTVPKVPLEEFRITCSMVPDVEFSHSYAHCGIPTVTCFSPSLPPGAPFHLSIHSWRTPEISAYTRSYTKFLEHFKFEARIFVDGHLVAANMFDRLASWPQLLGSSLELAHIGEHLPLRFPHFRPEILYQNLWNAGDELGRIKLIISECFPRDSSSAPVERVRNLVAFSFQHAPLELLENHEIAWPNPSMCREPWLWREQPLVSAFQSLSNDTIVPSGTPVGEAGDLGVSLAFTGDSSMRIPDDFAAALTQSLLNQAFPLPQVVQPHTIPLPASKVKSRKENRGNSPASSSPSLSSSPPMKKGVKRTRTFTPASARAIDDEDEPQRASPRAGSTGAPTTKEVEESSN